MTNDKLNINVCDLIYCRDIFSLYIGDIESEQNINSLKCYDTFGGVGVIYDPHDGSNDVLSQDCLDQYCYYFDVFIIFCDMSHNDYVQEDLNICKRYDTSLKLVIFCPILAAGCADNFNQEILPKLMNYKNIAIRPIINYLENCSNSMIERYMVANSDYYDDFDDGKVSDFIGILAKQFLPHNEILFKIPSEETDA